MVHTAAIARSVARLKHFPVSFFSMILGLTGFTIAVERAEVLWRRPPAAGQDHLTHGEICVPEN
jgi:hypothetical protein